MTVSMRVMSAGDGFRYLLRTVAAGDGDRSLSTPLTRYYSANGTPPGRWMGSGLAALGSTIVEGNEVSEEQLQRLIGLGCHPVSGEPLGRAYPVYEKGSGHEASRRRAVAGYDFTFSIPKSASVLWGVADATTQAAIVQAHHAAVAESLAFLEREVAATRTGVAVRDGAVAQVDVSGLTATAFDHFDSRAGDPHLHTHVVISNKAMTVHDGKWRSLDGRPMHAAVVAISELHETLFADALTRSIGAQWEQRSRGRDRNPAWAIATVPEALVTEFSTRSQHIDAETDRLIEAHTRARGRRPGRVTIMKLRAQATLSTRPAKEVRSLAELTAGWRERAASVLGTDAVSWARTAITNLPHAMLRADDIPLPKVGALGRAVMIAVSEKRSTWRHWNLVAEAARQTMGFRFASASDREAVIRLVVDAAERASLRLTPPELAPSPAPFQRADGSSVFRPKHPVVFSSAEVMAAEASLLKRSVDDTAPRVAPTTLRATLRAGSGRGAVDDAQVEALANIVASGRVVDVLVGPAGAGKTSAMSALRRVWEEEHGAGSVVGLAPSAAAAHVLAEDLGIPTENLAKWWHDHLRIGTTFRPDQLIIIDEASLAGTLYLDRVSALAAAGGAKVLLVGDPAQLQSVEAGGAFSLLVHDRPDAPELIEVRRFVNEWEKAASLALRHGDAEAIDEYIAHGRVLEGSTEAMADAAYLAWRADARAGKASVLISESNEAVSALNVRARTELILEGRIDALREAELHDGTAASVGDTVITRRNDRRLRAGRRWVRNGDRWTIATVRRDGGLEVQRPERPWRGTVVLPAAYVRRHVELGYAVTAHRAQGITTDTSHVVVASGTTRENLYVAMTRGRESNVAYVAVDRPDVSHIGPRPGDAEKATAQSVLYGVLQHVGADVSAHETLAAEQDAWGSIAQLAAEYETIAAAAQRSRWAELVRGCGLPLDQAESAIKSDAFGPLTAELRRAEAEHFDVEQLLSSSVRARGFDDAQDIAAVLRARVAAATVHGVGGRAGPSRKAPRLIAGLIPLVLGEIDPDARRALEERRALIEARADAILDQALHGKAPWTRALGVPPRGASEAWRRYALTVAAYLDRYGLTGAHALESEPQSGAQRADAARARRALGIARRLSDQARGADRRQPSVPTALPSVGRQF
ncbi:MobF family relaxase [Agromyces sp. NPDC049794]|uniref:MobF family relaxase n=1 Tax=unclassified Agromyces TaxID=2639701 RepID=UPI0033C1D452